ncbi:gliding motility-associated C-terminal domain-containing protein [Hymenobacter sp. BT186]|uniref:Gliding motility-associated C-terminal domain-containing protein n=1 Tax=Hymenobacter telluris TaxID=2816474 RepID=A0A939JDL2_9BACT|nr:gliding motility-associated C-terminal domain-containing protein [Hymenobacter telluris]MBO0359023.1 gliding motility-associated C-terminal domain-containing protein [Hymenobacter telluris]MBW3375049.1 gliding motility-associated C-terminal domain-containing protein [Hymenobacter norwichensis]
MLSLIRRLPDFSPRLPGLLLLFVLLLAFSRPGRATHIVGGEMDLQYLSGSTYQITLNLYFDALNGQPGALDSDLTVSIFDKNSNARMQNVVLPLSNNTLVNYTNPACSTPDLITRRIVYTARVELAANRYNSAGGYYAAVERCCRNNGINNIVNAADAGQTFYLEFPAVVRNGQPFRDSTPRIFPPLSDYACINELFYYDFGGQDADGDSLVYELATPFNGHATSVFPKPVAEPQPYQEITWSAGNSVNSQIPGAPTLSINRLTGRLQVRPTRQGLFVFGLKCVEYRKGVKIGEARRDFQLKVIPCAQNSTPTMTVQAATSRGPYREGRDTLRLRPGFSRCLNLRFTDADSPSRLSLSLRAVNFPGSLLPSFTLTQGMIKTPGAPDTLVSQLCFPSCFSSRGQVYYLDVIVADDGCSLPKRDTVRVAFTAQPDPNGPPALVSTAGPALPLRARVGDLITFDVTGTDPDSDPVTLTMTGVGFQPTELGATFVQGVNGNQTRGRFTWRVDCRAVGRPMHEFRFLASAGPCNDPQTVTLTVPIQVDYTNAPPVLATSLPRAPSATEPTVIRRLVGGVYEATFNGTDTDRDALVLSATGNGFELADAGMSFRPTNGNGQASATFRWDANCAGYDQVGRALEVTFQLQESTCQPVPQTRVVRFELINPDTVAFRPVNIFTPNGDDKNATFTVPDLPPDFCGSRFADVKIFSRWGNLVYQSKDRNFRWDGGQAVPGVYFYLIEYTDGRKFKGPITLER